MKGRNRVTRPKRKRAPSAMAQEVSRLRREYAALKARLDAEILSNATPALTIAAAAGHLLIVQCEGLNMRVRTRSIVVSTGRTTEAEDLMRRQT
jgi:hypothetical protein